MLPSERSERTFAIVPLANLRDPDHAAADIDAIFFSSSSRQSFADEEERRAFRERWLGRYLVHERAHGFAALAPDGSVIGYLVGSLADPARTALYSDIAYVRDFAAVTPLFPAHLHINLAAASRGLGVGSRLLTTFVSHAAARGALGVHVVTSRGVRNVGFYNRNGFHERASAPSDGRDVVLLGRSLADGRPAP